MSKRNALVATDRLSMASSMDVILKRLISYHPCLLFTKSRNPTKMAEIFHCFPRFFKAYARKASTINSRWFLFMWMLFCMGVKLGRSH